jgi:hypothetical protein
MHYERLLVYISKKSALAYLGCNSRTQEMTEYNLSFQVINHISNGAILRKPDAVNDNLDKEYLIRMFISRLRVIKI